MKILVYYLLPFIFFASCSGNDIQIPENVLPKEKMVQILTDVQITEAAMLLQSNKGNISKTRIPDYYQFIFKKHQITEKQFRESFTFYIGQVELMDNMYEEVINEISKRQAEVVN